MCFNSVWVSDGLGWLGSFVFILLLCLVGGFFVCGMIF